MQWHPIETAPRNELVLILGRYQLSLDPALIYVLGTFTDAAWKFDFPCPPELPPPQPPQPPPGPQPPNNFIPKFWMKLPPRPSV